MDASPNGYLDSYRIATAPEPNASRLTSFKSTCFDKPASARRDAGVGAATTCTR